MREGLRLAAELGGALLSGAGGHLVLVERVATHTAPRVAVLGRAPADLQSPLEAAALLQVEDGALNVVGLLPLEGTDLSVALQRERRRIGALVAALDAGVPWLGAHPMLVRCLPGRLRGEGALTPLALPSIQAFELRRYLGADPKFLQPQWRHGLAAWWPGTPCPSTAEADVPALELPTATPLAEALRAAQRKTTSGPVDFLPVDADPTPLHALRTLTLEATAFYGPRSAWLEAFRRLASLPAPPHFCARC